MPVVEGSDPLIAGHRYKVWKKPMTRPMNNADDKFEFIGTYYINPARTIPGYDFRRVVFREGLEMDRHGMTTGTTIKVKEVPEEPIGGGRRRRTRRRNTRRSRSRRH